MKRYYFLGKEVSAYGEQNGRVDYRTLASTFDAILNNDIMQKTYDIGYWEQVNGWIDYSEEIENVKDELSRKENYLNELMNHPKSEEWKDTIQLQKDCIKELEEKLEELEELEQCQYEEEIYQYYIIDRNGFDILEKYTNEIVYYNDELDIYLWGVTHFGTSWDYVLTDISLDECYSKE